MEKIGVWLYATKLKTLNILFLIKYVREPQEIKINEPNPKKQLFTYKKADLKFSQSDIFFFFAQIYMLWATNERLLTGVKIRVDEHIFILD